MWLSVPHGGSCARQPQDLNYASNKDWVLAYHLVVGGDMPLTTRASWVVALHCLSSGLLTTACLPKSDVQRPVSWAS